jgi:hypothetical protein
MCEVLRDGGIQEGKSNLRGATCEATFPGLCILERPSGAALDQPPHDR